MINQKRKLKSNSNSKYNLGKDNYINIAEVIKEVLSNKELNFNYHDEKLYQKKINSSGNKYINQNLKNKKISLKNLFSNQKSRNYSTKRIFYSNSPKISIISRPLSSQLQPYKAVTLDKRKGFNSKIIIKNLINLEPNNIRRRNKLTKCFSSENNLKKKRIKIENFEDIENIKKGKSPIESLVKKLELSFDYKLAHRRFSNDKVLNKFYKKNFKNVRNNLLLDKYYYIKSKLNSNTKSKENKLKNEDKILNFDNKKYKLFKIRSKNLKNKIKLSAQNLDVKKCIEKIKKKENVENLEKLSELKNVIEDEKILLTPKNFLQKKVDPFIYYKINKLIQNLDSNFTYKNRFILAKKFGIHLEKFLIDEDKNKNSKLNT